MAKCLTLEVDLSANFHPMHDFFVVNQGIILLKIQKWMALSDFILFVDI